MTKVYFYIDSYKENVEKKIKKYKSIYSDRGLTLSFKQQLNHIPYFHQSYTIQLIEKEDGNKVSNFFFYPTHKLIDFNGKEKILRGYRICCIRVLNGHDDVPFEKLVLDVSVDDFKSGKWLDLKALKKYNLKLNSKKKEKLMKMMSKKVKKEIITSSVVGWVKTKSNLHHFPIMNQKKLFKSTKEIRKNYPFSIDNEMDATQAYKKIKELMNITDSTATLPLLSYTVISTIRSLLKKHEPFSLNLSGEVQSNSKLIANLFCNLYNRDKHYFDLNSKFHVNNDLKTDRLKKLKKHRDSICINVINQRKDLSTYTKIDNNLSCGILFISSTPLSHDSVIDINIDRLSIDSEILDYHSNNPSAFTTGIHYLMCYIADLLIEQSNSLKQSFENCKLKIEQYSNAKFKPTKLEQCTWLLVGYTLFEQFGKSTEAITEDEFTQAINDAIAIFHKLCAIDINKLQNEPSINPLESESLLFIKEIDSLLTWEGLKKYDEKTENPAWGWYDREKLYLKNEEVFKKVEHSLKSKKQDIYKFLYKKGIIIDKPKNGFGNQFNKNTKVIHYHIENTISFLRDHGSDILFLDKIKENLV